MAIEHLSRSERIRGGLIGLLVGDALGVPYEFKPPALIPAPKEIEFDPPEGYPRTYPGLAPGTYSDDGAQALCLLASLLERGTLDPDDLGSRLLDWYENGYLAVNCHVFDVGIQTSQALRALKTGTPALEAGPVQERANGNGSLMRVLPLALWHKGTDEELAADACTQSQVTHGHIRSQLCCALYCLWARRTLEGFDHDASWNSATATLRSFLADDPEGLSELNQSLRPDHPPDATGRGYVVDSLHSARWATAAGSYEHRSSRRRSPWGITRTPPPRWPAASPGFAKATPPSRNAGAIDFSGKTFTSRCSIDLSNTRTTFARNTRGQITAVVCLPGQNKTKPNPFKAPDFRDFFPAFAFQEIEIGDRIRRPCLFAVAQSFRETGQSDDLEGPWI